MPDFTIYIDPALVLLDDAKDGRQTETRAFASILGGEERFKDARKVFGGNAEAGVADGQAHERASPGAVELRADRFIKVSSGSLNDEPAAFGHGVAGIHREIQQHLIQHAGVGMDAHRLQGKSELHLDIGTQNAAQHVGHPGDGLVQIQIAQLQNFLPAEQQQLPRQRRRTLGGDPDLLDAIRLVRGKPAVVHEQVHLQPDDRQDIVEIVRHAAGQLAEALHFLGLPKLRFHGFALGKIQHEANAFFKVVLKHCRAQQDRHARAVFANPFLLIRRANSGGGEFLQGALVEFGVFRRRHRHPVNGPGLQGLPRVARELQEGVVAIGDPAFGVPKNHALGVGVHQPAEATFNLFLVGEILRDHDQHGSLATGCLGGGNAVARPNNVSVLFQAALFQNVALPLAGQQLVPQLQLQGEVFRMGQRRKIPRLQLVFRVAEHPAIGPIGLKKATLRGRSGDASGGSVEQTAKSLLTFPEFLLRLPEEVRPATGIKNRVHFAAG